MHRCHADMLLRTAYHVIQLFDVHPTQTIKTARHLGMRQPSKHLAQTYSTQHTKHISRRRVVARWRSAVNMTD